MPVREHDRKTLNRIQQIVSSRSHTYETAVQTTVLGKLDAGWRNLLTLFTFVPKGAVAPHRLEHKYGQVTVVRRLLSSSEMSALSEKLLDQSLLETGTEPERVERPGGFSLPDNSRTYPREWSQWPGDIFIHEPADHIWAPQDPLTAVDHPYYPSLGHLLQFLLGIRSVSWMDYFKGRVIFVIPDFRARISKLVIGRNFLRAELDCPFAQLSQLVAKVYAENSALSLAQETVLLTEPSFELRLDDKASLVSVALLFKATGELLHEKSFDEGRGWRDRDVFIAISEQDIEQMLLTGENETIEFRQEIKNSAVRLAKTVVAFANTRGGSIIVGVDDDHRVVGCETKGLADTVTNIIRSHCEPPISVTTEIVEYKHKPLFIIRVPKIEGQVYTVREHGPFIRANATSRPPASAELKRLFNQSTTAQLPGLG